MPYSYLQLVSATLGGACIGLSALYTFVLEGRVMGLSGEATRLTRGSLRSILFLSGLLTASFALSMSPLSATQVPPNEPLRDVPLLLAIPAAASVGVGAALANGCTSGHGVCGLVRLSTRSIVAVSTFMAAACVVATTLSSASYFDAPSPPPLDSMPISAYISLVCLVVAPALLGVLAREYMVAERLVTVACGALFATGLTLSGMINPGRTLGFLDLSAPTWDPSMAFVFIGALPLSYAGFTTVKGRGTPLLAGTLQLPQMSEVDVRLILGALLFGTGWGALGVCPGPAFAYVAAVRSVKGATVLAAMISGLIAAQPLKL